MLVTVDLMVFITDEIVEEILFQTEDMVFLIPLTTLDIAPLMAFQIDENTDLIVFIIPEINPDIAFYTLDMVFEIAFKAVEIAVEIAFHIVWKKFLIPSSSGVINSTIVFHIACIFSEIQSITLLMIIWIASKMVCQGHHRLHRIQPQPLTLQNQNRRLSLQPLFLPP